MPIWLHKLRPARRWERYAPACVRIQHTLPRPEPSPARKVLRSFAFEKASSCAQKLGTLSTPFHVQNKATMFLCITSPLGTKTLLGNVTAIVLLLDAGVGVRRMCPISRKQFKHCRFTLTRRTKKTKQKKIKNPQVQSVCIKMELVTFIHSNIKACVFGRVSRGLTFKAV